MSASKKSSVIENKNQAAKNTSEFEADVLFQRIYDKWYAFSVVDEDCLVTEVSADEVQKRQMQTKKSLKAA